MDGTWAPALWLIATLIALVVINRWVNQHMQGVGLLLFGDEDGALLVTYLLLLPGIVLHEASHWVMAKSLGLRTGRLTLWPQRVRGHLRLGSIDVENGGPLLNSLVGVAPFLFGSSVLVLIGYQVFDAELLGTAWTTGDWKAALVSLWDSLQVRDSWLWLYLIFTVSNAMTPSTSDRAPWRPVIAFSLLLAAIAYLAGWMPRLSDIAVLQLNDAFRTLTYAFVFTLTIDIVFALFILISELTLSTARGQRVVYESSRKRHR
ncbi:MAG TPA: hypothetical protein EYP04_04570 [Anaerolineae bacterium]|nr:hypothetical protein [Anaerolineae bacterium]